MAAGPSTDAVNSRSGGVPNGGGLVLPRCFSAPWSSNQASPRRRDSPYAAGTQVGSTKEMSIPSTATIWGVLASAAAGSGA